MSAGNQCSQRNGWKEGQEALINLSGRLGYEALLFLDDQLNNMLIKNNL